MRSSLWNPSRGHELSYNIQILSLKNVLKDTFLIFMFTSNTREYGTIKIYQEPAPRNR